MPSLLIITPNYAPLICGVGHHSEVLAGRLRQRGWEVSILTKRTTGWCLLQAGKTEQHWGSQLSKAILHSLQHTPPHTRILWQYAPNGFSNKGMPVFLITLMLQLRIKGIRQYIFFHEIAMRTLGYGVRQMLLSIVQKWLANKMNVLANGSATSIALYQRYCWLYKPIIIPAGSNFQLPQQPPARLASEGLRCCCFTNRCSHALLQSFAQWKTNHSPHQLILIGQASPAQTAQIQQWLKELNIQSSVQCLGELPAAAMMEQLLLSDLVVQWQPRTANGQGGVSAKNGTIAAAMQAGKPIISIAGDMTETTYFRHGQTCWLLQEDTQQAWLQALQQLGSNAPLRQQLGHAAQACYQQYMSNTVLTDQFEELLSN
ncbi:glycosyltransferase [Phnomibacter sp. MR]|uniref:glycosyltransferase n=1 Tax=Phnomibacter sp. MR TaxID=3042318 RepID=UPI003A7FD234